MKNPMNIFPSGDSTVAVTINDRRRGVILVGLKRWGEKLFLLTAGKTVYRYYRTNV